MGAARIEGVDPKVAGFFARVFLRIIFWATRRKVGRVLTPMRVMGHSPRILFGYGMMEQSLAGASALPVALKTLASLRAASLVGCLF